MPNTETGHAPNRYYSDQSGNLHLNGSSIYVDEAGTAIAAADLVRLQTSSNIVAGGATITVTQALHNGKTIQLDTAAGTVATLPAATGSGARYRFMITTIATSNSHKVQVANASDFMVGGISTMSDDPATVKAFWAANSGTVSTNSDTITLNRTTTGSTQLGEWIEVQDVLANTWWVTGMTASTGTEATPFSAAV